MLESIPADWRSVLADSLDDPSLKSLDAFVARQRTESEVYPPIEDTFASLRLTPFASVRAVILGQDPYHQPGRAHGLAFSVPPDVALPGSLRIILKELETDLGRPVPEGGSLVPGRSMACSYSTPCSRSARALQVAMHTKAGSA